MGNPWDGDRKKMGFNHNIKDREDNGKIGEIGSGGLNMVEPKIKVRIEDEPSKLIGLALQNDGGGIFFRK